MSLRQYFRLLLDYRYIWIYPDEGTMACALMPTNYFVVVVLPSRQIRRVVRLTACNYGRCVFVTIFSGWKTRLRIDYKRYHLIKLIKTERLNRSQSLLCIISLCSTIADSCLSLGVRLLASLRRYVHKDLPRPPDLPSRDQSSRSTKGS